MWEFYCSGNNNNNKNINYRFFFFYIVIDIIFCGFIYWVYNCNL